MSDHAAVVVPDDRPRRAQGALAPATSGMAAASVLLLVGAGNAFLAASALGAAGKGLVTLVGVVNSLAVLALGLSLESGVMYFGSRVGGAGRQQLARRSVLLATVLAAPAGMAAAAAIVLLRGEAVSVGWALTVSLVWATQILVGPLVGLARLEGRLHEASWMPATVAAGPFAGSAVALLISPSVDMYFAGVVIGGLLAWAVFLPSAHRALRGSSGAEAVATVPVSAVVTYSLRGHLGALLHGLNLRIPLLVLAVTSSDAVVGVYSIALAVAEAPLVVSQGLLSWTLARAATAPSSYAALRQAVGLALVGTGAGSAALLALAPVALPALLGPDFAASVGPFTWSVPGVVCLAMWRLCAYDLSVRGNPRARTTSAAAGTVVALCGTALLCARYGADGAAAAATAAYAAMFIWLLAGSGDMRRALACRALVSP